MTSLRRRLLIGTAVATAVVFLAAAVSLYYLSRHFLIREFDTALASKAQMIATWIEFDGDRIGVDGGDLARFPEFVDDQDAEYYRIQTADGRFARSPTLRNAGDPAFPDQSSASFITLPDGRRGRAITLRTQPQLDADETPPGGTPTVSITLAKATIALDRLLMRLRGLLAIVCGLGAATLLIAGGLIIQRSLRPIGAVAQRIGAIGPAQLDARLDLSQAPRELRPIVTRLNEMLARLESAFEREKAFTADAAHELRTPLAGLETALEVCASQRREPARYEQTVGDCLKVVRQMHAMVDNLLMLARADSNGVRARVADNDLPELVRNQWSPYERAAESKRLCVEMAIDDGTCARVDPDLLANILRNLFDNAVHYADESGRIKIAATNVDGALKIVVANSGSRIKPADADKVFDRFWRGDTTRAAGRHAGLGLAVCRKLADAIGATITARSNDGTFAVELVLKRASEPGVRCQGPGDRSHESAVTVATKS